jgi:hypothetical protein
MDRLTSVEASIVIAVIALMSSGIAFAQNSNPPDTTVRDQLIVKFKTCCLVLLRHKRRRCDCRMQQGQRERFRAMATISLRRIVAIEFGM